MGLIPINFTVLSDHVFLLAFLISYANIEKLLIEELAIPLL